MRRVMVLVGVAALTSLVVSCAAPIKMAWVRTDGVPMHANPALVQQFEIDRTICAGETSKANLSGTQFCRGLADCMAQSAERQQGTATVAQGCMAQRGYLNVPEDQAEAKAAELRALARPAVAGPPPITTGQRTKR